MLYCILLMLFLNYLVKFVLRISCMADQHGISLYVWLGIMRLTFFFKSWLIWWTHLSLLLKICVFQIPKKKKKRLSRGFVPCFLVEGKQLSYTKPGFPCQILMLIISSWASFQCLAEQMYSICLSKGFSCTLQWTCWHSLLLLCIIEHFGPTRLE